MGRGRKKKEIEHILNEYYYVLWEIDRGTPYREIAAKYGIGLSTVQRVRNRFRGF